MNFILSMYKMSQKHDFRNAKHTDKKIPNRNNKLSTNTNNIDRVGSKLLHPKTTNHSTTVMKTDDHDISYDIIPFKYKTSILKNIKIVTKLRKIYSEFLKGLNDEERGALLDYKLTSNNINNILYNPTIDIYYPIWKFDKIPRNLTWDLDKPISYSISENINNPENLNPYFNTNNINKLINIFNNPNIPYITYPVLYRGVNMEDNAYDDIKIGQDFMFTTFLSTSFVKEVAFKFNYSTCCIFVFKNVKNIPSIYIDYATNISYITTVSEEEVILPPYTKWTVRNIYYSLIPKSSYNINSTSPKTAINTEDKLIKIIEFEYIDYKPISKYNVTHTSDITLNVNINFQ